MNHVAPMYKIGCDKFMAAVDINCSPFDAGRKDWRCGSGPKRILQQDAIARIEATGADMRLIEIEPRVFYESENSMGFEIQRRISEAAANACREKRLPLVIAGNCNAAVGGISGIGGGSKRGHVWFDAHGDFCTPETTDSGFLDGMGLAMMVGRCWQRVLSHMTGYEPITETATALVGARDLDSLEAEDLAASAITHLRVEDIRENGVEVAFKPFLHNLAQEVEQVYIHVDLDVHDPLKVPANR